MTKESAAIVISGEAGQGIQTLETILVNLFKFSGYNVFSVKEYMSRVRGGNNTVLIRVSSKKIRAFVNNIDLLIPLNKGACNRLHSRISADTLILGDEEIICENLPAENKIQAPILKSALELGSKIYSNTITAGIIARLFNIDEQILKKQINKFFTNKDTATNNTKAALLGHSMVNKLKDTNNIGFKISRKEHIKQEYLLKGADAVAMGAIAGGCNFISAYPMSPSTGILTFLSQNSEKFGIVSEQAEDEISAINMAIGAWYAGARALVNTSGGGFALMAEALSLSAMIESPLVVHIASRPGPATGLPTRTEQGDLKLALYSGHGEFPRIIFAPGNIEDALSLTQISFDLADKFQVPVFILTDQYLLDSHYNTSTINPGRHHIHKNIIKTNTDYFRYKFNKDGISPRGIPGHGEGLVCLDSDEHDESGHITEDMSMRTKMVEKRLGKTHKINNAILAPDLFGNENYKILIIGWGSTKNIIKEALNNINSDEVSFLHFNQVFPLHPSTIDLLMKADKKIIIENNATAQFGKLLKLNTGIDMDEKILKYNGLPFSAEEVEIKIREVLKRHKTLSKEAALM
jgi:2-oxoglutarate ferredoxin oxidoreductase subunit alpha